MRSPDVPAFIDDDEYFQRQVSFCDNAALLAHLRALGISFREIGASREGRAIYGMSVGRGPRRVSIIAGSHADEPAGPMTAQALPLLLSRYAPALLNAFTFYIVPQINPDGANRNRPWFADPPQLFSYATHAVRELPGDDIEYGFGPRDTRPECNAAMDFLRPHAPFAAHFSLHGMGYSEGAWFLISKAWAAKSQALMQDLSSVCATRELPLFDIDRGGEKGFYRIRPGFCTTPTSEGMRKYFTGRNDPAEAAKFQASSMEFIASVSAPAAPLCMVSELPIFLIGAAVPPYGGGTLERFRDSLRRALPSGDAVDRIQSEFGLHPIGFAVQMQLQFAMILAAINQIALNDHAQ